MKTLEESAIAQIPDAIASKLGECSNPLCDEDLEPMRGTLRIEATK